MTKKWTQAAATAVALIVTLTTVGVGLISFRSADAMLIPRLVNPGVEQFDSPERFSAVFAVSDIHGMFIPLVRVLNSAQILNTQGHWIAGNSLLIVVGDSIDKGPKSIEVIDFWMQLTQEAAQRGGAVVHLLGNHEAEFLADPIDDDKATELLAELKARGMSISDMVDPSKPRGAFLRSMPVAARVGRWLFAHSGYIEQPNFRQFVATASPLLQKQDYLDPFFTGKTSVLEAKDWWSAGSASRSHIEAMLNASGLYGLVFGHQPSALNVKGASAISVDRRLIKIDNGMAPDAGAHVGSVLVFPQPAQLKSLSMPSVGTILSGSSQIQALQTEAVGVASSADDSSELE